MELREIMEKTGAACWGTVSYASLRVQMNERQQKRAELLCPNPAGVIVAAFSYFAGYSAGNIGLYARGRDYHTVLGERLEYAAQELRAANKRTFVPLVDASPLPEKTAAAMAGLGVIGRNTLLQTPANGSFLFLGCILTDMPLTGGGEIRSCMGCGECIKACPGGALSVKNGRAHLDRERCLSALTQKKGALTEEQTGLIRTGGLIWGCDRCQRVCPANRDIPLTSIPEFQQGKGYLPSLDARALKSLSDGDFLKLCGDRAFSWRGKDVLIRNGEILK